MGLPFQKSLLSKDVRLTTIQPASANTQVKAYMEDGDKMGRLWTEGSFEKVDP